MRPMILAVTLSAFIVIPSIAFAQTCSGHWGGRNATSVTFTGGNGLRYCYGTQCWNSTYSGDRNGQMRFSVGNSRVDMTARSGGYSANWTAGATSRAPF